MKTAVERLPEAISKQQDVLAHMRNDQKAAAEIEELAMQLPDGKAVTDKKIINAHLLKMAQKQHEDVQHFQTSNIPPASINGFAVSVMHTGSEIFFAVKGEQSYSCSAGITENQDNYQRLSNLFEKEIARQADNVELKVEQLKENLQQARERILIPFAQEVALEAKTQELQELEDKLIGISAPEDDVLDLDEEDIEETADERTAREAKYQADEDDYIPTETENRPNIPAHR